MGTRYTAGLAVAVLSSACFFVAEDGDTDTDTEGETEETSGPQRTSESTTGNPNPGSTGQPWEQTGACNAWLQCVPLSRLADLEEVYGPTGSCWQTSPGMVESCDAECIDGYNEDCEGPPPTTNDPSTSDDGTTGPVYEECSFEELAPDAERWIEAGEEEGLIPAEVGVIIEDYCSCHLAEPEEFNVLTPMYYGNLRFHTLEELQSPWQGQPTYVKVRQRVFGDLSMPPLYYCGDGDYGSSIHSPEYELFEAWLLAGAPDAPTWAEMRR